MWNLVSLDGYFEGARSWEIDWHEYVWGEELERFAIEQSKTTGMLLFGRVTYEGMASYWPSQKGEIADFMNTIPKVVFSRTLGKADWSNAKLVTGKPEEEVARLKQEPGGNLTIFGSATLCATLMRHGLIDEYQLGVVPVVLGRGNPLFKAGPDRMRLQLIEARPTKSGCVILSYRPATTP
ncbi:MAG: dihydrofolate reductase family protein [Methanobacteriota archaeon]